MEVDKGRHGRPCSFQNLRPILPSSRHELQGLQKVDSALIRWVATTTISYDDHIPKRPTGDSVDRFHCATALLDCHRKNTSVTRITCDERRVFQYDSRVNHREIQ